jgi:cytochrome c biogenesis protein CcmG/thiol:disulfide interchange protein DsbE
MTDATTDGLQKATAEVPPRHLNDYLSRSARTDPLPGGSAPCGNLFSVRLDVCLVVLAIPLGLAVGGCGSATPTHSAGPSRAAIRAAFRGSPASLAAVHAQADELLGGESPALEARLRALRGHPVIVNLWASWCGSCQGEFPVFQQTAVRYGRRVAFLGVDERDTRANATAWLRRFPVTYPSYFDPRRSIDVTLRTLEGTPQTFFFNARGQEQFDHGGAYSSVASLSSDIRTYLGVR